MSGAKAAKKKLSFWQTLHAASGRTGGSTVTSNLQVAFYHGPGTGSCLRRRQFAFPFSDCPGDKHDFPRHRAQPDGNALKSSRARHRPKDQFHRSALSRDPGGHDRPQPLFLRNTYYMKWVSNKVLTDIRSQLFSKMVRHSMDFFNKMRSGFLMSRITNNTRVMQMALDQRQQRSFQAANRHRRRQSASCSTWIGSLRS